MSRKMNWVFSNYNMYLQTMIVIGWFQRWYGKTSYWFGVEEIAPCFPELTWGYFGWVFADLVAVILWTPSIPLFGSRINSSHCLESAWTLLKCPFEWNVGFEEWYPSWSNIISRYVSKNSFPRCAPPPKVEIVDQVT